MASLEDRVQALEDIAAIKDLKHTYLRACDRQLPDVVRACFDPDGVVIAYDGFPPFNDREAFVKVYREMGCKPSIVDMHHAHNPLITLTSPTSAKGTWELFFSNIDMAARTHIQMACEYDDEYVKKNGRWLIKKTATKRYSFMMHKIDDDGNATVVALGKPPVAPFGAEPARKN